MTEEKHLKENKTDELVETIQETEEATNQELEQAEDQSASEQIEAMEEAEAKLDAIQEEEEYLAEKSPIAGVSLSNFKSLTGKSQQFMVNLDRHLVDELDYEVRSIAYIDMVDTLLEGQQSGQTARQLFGTPTEVAQSIIDQDLKVAEEDGSKSPDWHIYIDGALLLGSIFTFLTGFSMANADNTAGQLGNETLQYFGVITMILNYLVAGFAMLVTAKNMPNPDAPKGQKGYPKYFLASIGSMVVWFLVVSFSGALLPHAINPILPHTAYMIIAVITFLARMYLKRKLDIKGGIF
ncbi:DUF1129 family protein [Aerococcaceae bacterium DSM 111022]|nr:DUF1129 family protein [Aerococcaceae bacterium DSM 111022]